MASLNWYKNKIYLGCEPKGTKNKSGKLIITWAGMLGQVTDKNGVGEELGGFMEILSITDLNNGGIVYL